MGGLKVGYRAGKGVLSRLPTDGMHRAIGLHELRAIDFVAFALGPDVGADRVGQRILIKGRGAEQRFHVDLIVGEQAVAKLAVGGEPHAVATAAERPAHAGYESDSTDAVGVVEILGGSM